MESSMNKRDQLIFPFPELYHSAYALAKNALYLVLLIGLFCFGIKGQRNAR